MKTNIFLLVAMLFLIIGTPTHAQHCKAKKGDSMYRISKRYKVDFSELLRMNRHYPDQDLIHPNDKIEMPENTTGTSTNKSNNQKGEETITNANLTNQALEVLDLVNAERKKNGLKELVLSHELSGIATEKAEDMARNNYFDHTSPTYGTPFEMLQRFGVQYRSAGENIAAGQPDAKTVMADWLNSSGHRANILNPDYEQMGVGYVDGGSYGTYWVQLFIKNEEKNNKKIKKYF